ncbi:unnamed protein product [Pieris brassicae]|uniref:Gem-associated protein 7 n=1 Tax=Pieris brassicae TaxID=7116 RepID=A0A9P0WYD5_PIEBR|nr:unnamed protein product [Pieris brassicae]
MLPETETCNKQLARAKLREAFLRSVMELEGKVCKILTYEKSVLEATFSGWNPDGSEILVKNMKTPAHLQMDSALLRTPDILSITFVNSLEES